MPHGFEEDATEVDRTFDHLPKVMVDDVTAIIRKSGPVRGEKFVRTMLVARPRPRSRPRSRNRWLFWVLVGLPVSLLICELYRRLVG